MANVTGIAIADITESGWSDDGRHIWISHRLNDGSEYRLIYPCEAASYLLSTIRYVTRSAYRQLASNNPGDAADGMNTDIITARTTRVGTAPEGKAAILHITTADDVPMAVEIPVACLEELANALLRVRENAPDRRGKQRLH
jgi:hypothetical protein